MLAAAALLLCTGLCTSASAQTRGFQINRFDPALSGSLFARVQSPYYSSEQSLAAGFTLGYAHNVLQYAESGPTLNGLQNAHPIIEHQLMGYLDVAGAIRDRVLLGAMLPLILLERGRATFDVAPIAGAAVSDPRLSAHVRIYGQPHKSRWSAHAGLEVWLPLRAISNGLPLHTSDQGARLRLSAIASGIVRSFRYAGYLAVQIRSDEQLGDRLDPVGASTGSDIELGLAAAYQLPALRLTVGPELLFSTSLLPSRAFTVGATSLELMASAQHVIAKRVRIGLAVGMGFLSDPGTPDVRVALRVAYVATTRDRDQDGIVDEEDACPDQKGFRSDVPSNNGCPAIPDRDCDGIEDSEDECPDVPEGRRPDPARLGCPLRTRPPRSQEAPADSAPRPGA